MLSLQLIDSNYKLNINTYYSSLNKNVNSLLLEFQTP